MSALDKLNGLLSANNAEQAINAATQYVRAYTRDQGFTGGEPEDEALEVVIASVAARLMANPTQVVSQESLGSRSVTHFRFDGFTLLEQTVLNRYRVRAQ